MSTKSKIESLLFISAKPMSIAKLAELIKKESKDIKTACDELVDDYKKSNNGIQIIKNATKYQMVSSPENTKLVQAFINDETTGELSRPSLETLTIIAYRGPISKIDLDRIRGVNCSLILRNLLIRGLIEVRHDKKKEEDYYSVTFDFIRFLGINDISGLPDYEKLSKDDTIERIIEGEDQDNNFSATEEDQKDSVLKDENISEGESSDAEAMEDEDEECEKNDDIEETEDEDYEGDDEEEETEDEDYEGDDEEEEAEDEDYEGDDEEEETEDEDYEGDDEEEETEDDDNDKKVKIKVKIDNN